MCIQQQTVLEQIEEQVGVIPVPPIVEETVEVVELFPESVDDRIVDFPVPPMMKEIPIIVSYAAHAAPTPVNECAAPVLDVAHATPAPEVDVPLHNNVGQEMTPTTLNPVEISIPSSMLSISDDFAKMLDNLKNIEKETERVVMLTKRMMETPLPEPLMVEPPVVKSDRASAKRRRRTRYTPLPGQCTWLLAATRRLCPVHLWTLDRQCDGL